MDEPSFEEDSVIKRHPGWFDGRLALILIILLLFILSLYFEYKKSTGIQYTAKPAISNTTSIPVSKPPVTSATTIAQRFYQATAQGNLDKMRNMLNQLHDHDINKVNNGMTPIMKASSMGRKDIVSFLLEQGADPNKWGSSNRTALQYAAERNQLAVAKLLIQHGADINGVDNSRLSPLVMAVDRRFHELAMYLIDAGADVNIQHVQGWTALNYAEHHKRYEVIPYLVQNN